MKHLKIFNTVAEFESATIVKPNVSLIKETNVLNYKPNKIEIIEYHFEVPLAFDEGEHAIADNTLYGWIGQDFSEIYDKLYNFAMEFGEKSEYGFVYAYDDLMLNNTNITANGLRMDQIELWGDYGDVIWMRAFTLPVSPHGDNSVYLSPTSFFVQFNADLFPEYKTIYSFDIPLGEPINGKQTGKIEGDFSKEFAALKDYIITNGYKSGGYYCDYIGGRGTELIINGNMAGECKITGSSASYISVDVVSKWENGSWVVTDTAIITSTSITYTKTL